MSGLFEIIRSYPLLFGAQVVLPLLTGLIVAAVGLDSLKRHQASNEQAQRVEVGVERLVRAVPDLEERLAQLSYYEERLRGQDQTDEALIAVIRQYQRMKAAAEAFTRYQNRPATEVGDLSAEVLDLIGENVLQVTVDKTLPGQPLIIGLGTNTFRVLFAVPMRVSPRLSFLGLPEGITSEVSHLSQFGFTVTFYPTTKPVQRFGFEADAEL